MVDPFLKQSEVGQVSTGLQVKWALKQVVDHPVAKTTVYRVLKRHPWRKVVPRPHHPQSSAAEQEAFKNFPRTVAIVLQTRAPQDIRLVLILAQDEGRLGRIDPPRRCWAPKPVRPTVPCQIVREFIYVVAAVCVSLGRLTALILPRANTEMMTLFLAHVVEEFAGYFIVMLLDRAGWHMAKRLTVPENIRLLPPQRAVLSSAQPSIFGKNCARRACLIILFAP